MQLDFNKSLSPYNFIINKICNSASSLMSVTSNNKFISYINETNNITVLEYNNDPIVPKIVDNILCNEILSRKALNIVSVYFTALYENIIILFFSDGSIGFVNINIIDGEYIYALVK